jgi:hypothetical protein
MTVGRFVFCLTRTLDAATPRHLYARAQNLRRAETHIQSLLDFSDDTCATPSPTTHTYRRYEAQPRGGLVVAPLCVWDGVAIQPPRRFHGGGGDLVSSGGGKDGEEGPMKIRVRLARCYMPRRWLEKPAFMSCLQSRGGGAGGPGPAPGQSGPPPGPE